MENSFEAKSSSGGSMKQRHQTEQVARKAKRDQVFENRINSSPLFRRAQSVIDQTTLRIADQKQWKQDERDCVGDLDMKSTHEDAVRWGKLIQASLDGAQDVTPKKFLNIVYHAMDDAFVERPSKDSFKAMVLLLQSTEIGAKHEIGEAFAKGYIALPPAPPKVSNRRHLVSGFKKIAAGQVVEGAGQALTAIKQGGRKHLRSHHTLGR